MSVSNKPRLLCSTGVTAPHGAVGAGASTSVGGVECVCTCCLLIAAMHQACSQRESRILEEALVSEGLWLCMHAGHVYVCDKKRLGHVCNA